MLTNFQTTIMVFLLLLVAQAFTLLVNRCWPAVKRARLNDVMGWQVTILGTTYAVILGFMLFTVWTQYGVAELNADSEANALMSVYRLADGLPEPQRDELKNGARRYVDLVLQQDWPAMFAGEEPPFKSREANQEMWQTIMSIKNASPTELVAEDHALTEVDSVSQDHQMGNCRVYPALLESSGLFCSLEQRSQSFRAASWATATLYFTRPMYLRSL